MRGAQHGKQVLKLYVFVSINTNRDQYVDIHQICVRQG